MIILSIGSNLPSKYGDRFDNINLSISLLEGYGIKLIKRSSFYETPSYPNNKNPKFINVAINASTQLSATDLASMIIFIEEKLERKRNLKNDPRTCDIDIIDYQNKIVNFKYKNLEFKVPHEKLSKRNFVLIPLMEILPKWNHPLTKEPIALLCDKLSDEDKNSILKVKKP